MHRSVRHALVLGIALALLLGACGDTSSEEATPTTSAADDATRAAAKPVRPTTHQLSSDDSNKRLTVKVGDTIRVVLEQCTQCRWAQTKAADEKVLLFDGGRTVEQQSDDGKPPLPGAPATWVGTYKVVGEGATEAVLAREIVGDDQKEEFLLKVDANTAAGQSVRAKTYNLSESDSGTKLTMKKGDKLYVTLYNCDSCGYELQVVTKPNARVLEEDPKAADSTTTTTSTTTPEGGALVGNGSDEIFGWDAVGKGTTSIKVDTIPSWEPESAETVFTLDVTVT